jgi:hypothetical protein
MRKKAISVILSVIMLVVFGTVAFATSYSSTLSISCNSSVTGATRSYIGATHLIKIKLSSRTYNVPNNFCYVSLRKVAGFSDTEKNKKLLMLNVVGETYSMTSANQTDGNFYYYFTNYAISCDNLTKSNNVEMSSK